MMFQNESQFCYLFISEVLNVDLVFGYYNYMAWMCPRLIYVVSSECTVVNIFLLALFLRNVFW